MKYTASLLFLSSSFLSTSTLAQETDSQVTASWESSGTCAYFYEKPGAWKSLAETCVKYCESQPDGHGYSECDYAAWNDFDIPNGIDPSLIGHDDSGDVYVPCKCKCSNPDVEGITTAIFEVVAEALSHLDEIICGVFMTAMVSVVEIGIDMIPGGAEATAAARAVQGVKSFTENALDVADSMGNWIGKACGIQDPNWPNSIFDVLLTSPDSYGTSVGCKKKNKADCKGVDPVPDKPKTRSPDDPATKQPDPVTSAPQVEPTSAPQAEPTSAAEPPKSSEAAPPASTSVPPVSSNVDQPTASGSPTASADPTATPSTDPSVTTSGTVTASSSTSDSCASGTATQSGSSCEATSPCQITNPEPGGDAAMFEDITDTLAPIFNLGGVLRSRGIDGHRSPRSLHRLSKRDKKTGNPCSSNSAYKDFKLSSDEYPSNGQLDANVPSWGYKKQNDKCDYEWLDGKVQIAGNDYDSEHVMEWQIVTDFFQKMQAKGGSNYDHPDPNQAGVKTDFCTYWIESWSLEDAQGFSIDNGAAMTPWSHIASAYPSKQNFKAEMIRLQNNINQRAKANLFTDTIPFVWNEKSMDKMVTSNRDKVLERLRLLLGARTYLVDPKVVAIFKKQKERMGEMIDQLDTDMETHTRTTTQTTTDANGQTTTTTVSYTPWKKQDLLTEWNTYMDTKWSDAIAKHKKVMDKYTDDLEDKHCLTNPSKAADRQFCERLRKLQTAYTGATAFAKPW